MFKTFLIGTGYLSSKISKKIKNSEIVSSDNFIKSINKINKDKKKINLIINIFYFFKKLNNLISYKFFVQNSLIGI